MSGVSYGIAPEGTFTEGPQQQAWTMTVPEEFCQRQEAETKQLDPACDLGFGVRGHAWNDCAATCPWSLPGV